MGLGSSAPIKKTVVVVGGGYAGLAIAQALDAQLDVVVIEKKEAFLHSVGGLRASVLPQWSDLLLIPYDKALARGRVQQGEVVSVDQSSQEVVLASGTRLHYDYLVLATGASPFLLGRAGGLTSSADIKAGFATVAQAIAKAGSIAIVGGGAVGVEMAGEVKAAYPNKTVTLVHSGPALLSAAPPAALPAFQANVQAKLTQLGVKVVLNDKVDFDRSKLVVERGAGSPALKTAKGGVTVEAELLLNATGIPLDASKPLLKTLPGEAVDAHGFIKVNQFFQVGGGDSVIFALGDAVSLPWPEAKTIIAAKMAQVPVVSKNILSLAKGRKQALVPGKPSPAAMFVPVGPAAGAGYFGGMQVPGFLAVAVKAKDTMVASVRKDLHQPTPAPLPSIQPDPKLASA